MPLFKSFELIPCDVFKEISGTILMSQECKVLEYQLLKV